MKSHNHSCSFRDPAGFLLKNDEGIFRVIHNSEKDNFMEILSSKTILKHIANKNLVQTKIIEAKRVNLCGTVAEHEAIDFPSYPYEWSSGMLQSAGLLTLQLAEELLSENMGLKDATPYNVLFRGPNPVFVDMLSFEKRNPQDPIWTPYAQFLRTFLLPLIAHAHFKVPLSQIFLTRRDGIEAEEVYQLIPGLKKLKPQFLSLITIPTFLARLSSKKNESSIYRNHYVNKPELAKYILKNMFRKLRKQLLKQYVLRNTRWSGYMTLEKSYSDHQFIHKNAIIEDILQKQKPKKVLDIGCNKGHFSMLAAKHEAQVVAIDFDSAVIDNVWREAKAKNLDILPLVIDISRPSPGTGWNNSENLSFLDRAQGKFDLVFMLAVIHHLLAQERIPLEEIIQMAHRLTTKDLIIEYIAPDDPMFKRIARGRDHLYTYLTQDHFESVSSECFTVCSKTRVADSRRWLYHLRKINL